MGTRARIAIENPDGTYLSIYTHWDGYPSHHGPLLIGHYDTEFKVRSLLALGNLSVLASSLEECLAYGGDEDMAETSEALDMLRWLTQDCEGEWLYVFTPTGWMCAGALVPLAGVMAAHPD